MAAYCTISDIENRIGRTLSESESTIANSLIGSAALIIDAQNADASSDAKNEVSIRMIVRAMGDSEGVPIGATQGSMSALGYSQSWTMGNNASVGQLYLDRTDKKLLGGGALLGAHSPVEGLVDERR